MTAGRRGPNVTACAKGARIRSCAIATHLARWLPVPLVQVLLLLLLPLPLPVPVQFATRVTQLESVSKAFAV